MQLTTDNRRQKTGGRKQAARNAARVRARATRGPHSKRSCESAANMLSITERICSGVFTERCERTEPACVCMFARARQTHSRAHTRVCLPGVWATLLCRRRATCNMQHATDNRQHATCARCMGVSLLCRRRESLCRYIWRSSRTRWRAAMPPALIRSDPRRSDCGL